MCPPCWRSRTSGPSSTCAPPRSWPSTASRFDVGQGECVGHRRRVGLRQDARSASRSCGCCRATAVSRRDRSRLLRPGPGPAEREGDAAGPRQRGGPHPPGPDDLAQPDHDDRPPDRRGGPAAPRRRPRREARAARPRGPRRWSRCPGRRAPRPVPPRALRRAAPAGDDRHGAGLRPEAARSPTSPRPPSTSPSRPRSST